MYKERDYQNLFNIAKISRELFTAHFALYSGYIKNTNNLLEMIKKLPKDSAEFSELNRRLGWEFNGMRLHELFFENITDKPKEIEACPEIFNKIQIDFGSFDSWEEEFYSLALSRGIGWVVLYHDRWQDKLLNVWIEQHDRGHLCGGRPLIVVDLFEHAFLPDKLRKPDYVDIIHGIIDWNSANERLKA